MSDVTLPGPLSRYQARCPSHGRRGDTQRPLPTPGPWPCPRLRAPLPAAAPAGPSGARGLTAPACARVCLPHGACLYAHRTCTPLFRQCDDVAQQCGEARVPR
jgi:hypothetical protein